MAKSTRKATRTKPKKPTKDFPLWPHPNGQWCKKISGRQVYFGSWDDPDGALQRWHERAAGHTPQETADDGLTVKTLADAFLTAKRRRVDSDELSAHSYRDYLVVCQFVADHFGKHRAVSDLRPTDFAGLRAAFANQIFSHRLSFPSSLPGDSGNSREH